MALRSKAASKTEYNSRPFTKSNLAGRSFCLGVMPIPCPHFKITIVKRSQGQSAVAGAAYQSGERLFSEYDQRTKFYNKKKELVHAEIMLPSYAPPGYADRATLWNAVEAVENQWNSQLARRIVLAFPVEVPKEQYLSMDDMRNTLAPLYGKAEPATAKTTMSVREMQHLLGLGKTDSYWLLHKNFFEVILINDKMRIVISSFEKWYANQVKYHKVNGPPPGEELCKRSYSILEVAEILKVDSDTVYTLIRQGKLKAETVDFWMRIPKEEFERWYRSQSRHRTAADRERDREIEAQTISIPEMAKLLGIPREKVYWILDCKKYRDCFVIERVADRRRITKTSFEIWLNSQSTYRLQEPVMEAHEEPPLELKCPKSEKYYSFQEIQDFYGVSRTTLVTWIREEGIPTIDVGRAKRVRKDVFDDVLKSKRKVEGDT